MCDVDMTENGVSLFTVHNFTTTMYIFSISQEKIPNMSVRKMMLKCYFLFFFLTILYQETSLLLNLPILILHNLFSKLKRKISKFMILKNNFYLFIF